MAFLIGFDRFASNRAHAQVENEQVQDSDTGPGLLDTEILSSQQYKY